MNKSKALVNDYRPEILVNVSFPVNGYDFFPILVHQCILSMDQGMKVDTFYSPELRRAGAVLQANFTSWKKMLYSFFVEVELRSVGQLQILKSTGRAGTMKKLSLREMCRIVLQVQGTKKADRMVLF